MRRPAVDPRRARRAAGANCKTREEADQLYINKMQGYLSAARTISSNPNLSVAEKKGQLERIARRMIGIQTEQKIFIKNGDYERLPSEQEIQTKAPIPPKKARGSYWCAGTGRE